MTLDRSYSRSDRSLKTSDTVELLRTISLQPLGNKITDKSVVDRILVKTGISSGLCGCYLAKAEVGPSDCV